MNSKEARIAAVAIDERVNIVERFRDVGGTLPAVYMFARAYTTKSGRFSVEILGCGASWPTAVADLQARAKGRG